MKAILLSLIVAALSVTGAPPARSAQSDAGTAAQHAGQTHLGTGTVTFVDAANARVKIAHDAIPSLKWPPMRMEFKTRDAGVLQGIAKGDKVQFELMQSGDEYVITRIAPMKQ